MHRKHLDSIQIGAIIHHHKREILKHSLAAHPSKHSCFGAIWLLQNALDRSKRRALRCQRDIPNERRLDDYEHLPTLTIRFVARTQKRENLSIRKTTDMENNWIWNSIFMSQSSAFSARIAKEQKMFTYNPPPGISEKSTVIRRSVCLLYWQ